MSDTPETDDATLRAIDIEGGGEFDAVHVQVAKRLEREQDNAKAVVNALVCENERLRDARAKAESGELLLELTIGMMDQDIATIREIIAQGGTSADILKFLDTQNP